MESEGLAGEANGEAVGRCMSSYVDQGSTESHRYYLAFKTAMEMLRDRGYSVAASDLSLSLSEFRAKYGPIVDYERLRFPPFTHRSDPSKRVNSSSFFYSLFCLWGFCIFSSIGVWIQIVGFLAFSIFYTTSV